MNSLGKLYFLQGINYGRRPITTIISFIFVLRTRRGFMDGPGSEKTRAFCKVRFEMYAKKRVHLGGGSRGMFPWENFKNL